MARVTGSAAAPDVSAVRARSLVSRDRESAWLTARLDDAVGEGRGGVVFVTGEAGLGKSRLVQELADDAATRGVTVVRGHAVASVGSAYRPIAEALATFATNPVIARSTDLAPHRGALAALSPAWAHPPTQPSTPSPTPPQETSLVAVAEAVRVLLRVGAEGHGVLLVLEDLHWSDPESMAVVEYLADNLESTRVLCVATLRDDASGPISEVVHRLVDRRVSEAWELRPLDEDGVRRLLVDCLRCDHVPDAVVELASRADGVPFLVEELIAGAVSAGSLRSIGTGWESSPALDPVVPRSFADSVRQRLDGLTEQARDVVRAAAVFGRGFPWTLLPETSGHPEAVAVAGLRAAAAVGLIEEGPGPGDFQFRHALSRTAVLAQLFPPERQALAAAALRALDAHDAAAGEDTRPVVIRLARQANQGERAARLGLEVGEEAWRAGTLGSAELALTEARSDAAADGSPLLDLIEERLVEVLALAGKRDDAMTVGTALLDRLEADTSSAGRRARTRLLLARAQIAATQWPAATALLSQAAVDIASVPESERPPYLCRHSVLDAVVALALDERSRAEDQARAAVSEAARLSLWDVACDARVVIGQCLRPTDLDAAEREFVQALDLAQAHGLGLWKIRATHELGTIDLLRSGQLERLREARDLALQVGAFETAANVMLQLCGVLVAGDDVDADDGVIATARQAARIAERYGMRQTWAVALGFEAMGHGRAGRRTSMERCLARAAEEATGDPSAVFVAACARLLLAFAEEDREQQLGVLEPAQIHDQGLFVGWWALLQALEPTDAGEQVKQVVGRGDPGHFLGRGFLPLAQAAVAGRAGQSELVEQFVKESDQVLQRFIWCRQLGRRLLAEAAVSGRWGDPVSWLNEAEAYFHARGAEPNASACRSLLRRAGAPVRRRRPGEVGVPEALAAYGITVREREVLTLLADGLPNGAIAERLYLSPRTVERHVANMAVKVGVPGRTQLVAFAAREIAQLGDQTP